MHYSEVMFPGMEALCRVMATDPKHMASYIYPPPLSTSLAQPDLPTSITANPYVSPDEQFPFLELPLEIRLKVYSFLLPPRIHKIAPTLSYPLGPSFTLATTPSSTFPYKILTTNTHPSFPYPAIQTSLSLVSHQIRRETEPLIYGSKGTTFDFGTSVELIEPFFKDRSALARSSVRNLKIARELSVCSTDHKWISFVQNLPDVLPNISLLDITFWSETGTADCFPGSIHDQGGPGAECQDKWGKWTWTEKLLKMEGLREVKIRCWDFRGRDSGEKLEGGEGKEGFDCWLAGRMASDEGLRGRAVWDGVVREGGVVLRF